MPPTGASRKGMSRILDGIIKYRQTLRPSLLQEFKKVALGPSVRSEGARATLDEQRHFSS